jgi:hypothetical protein
MTRRYRPASEVAPELDMHPKTLLRKARRREIGCFRDGPKVLFSDEHIAAYLAARDHPAQPVQKAARISR